MAKNTSHTLTRLVDTSFDNKQLPPICGYWSEKLLPLEQALKRIVPRIEQLDCSIEEAKKYCHFPSEHGLTLDESAALYLYTMEEGDNSFYRVLNHALRSEDRPALKPWFPYLKLFDTALSKLPTVRGSVWRGVHGDIGKDFQKNQMLTWWSVTSCSLSVDVVKNFLDPETTSTLFMIEVVHGKDISGYTNYSIEDEVLLSPGIQLRVAANPLNLPGSLCIVHLIEIRDDSDEQLSSSMSAMHILPRSADKGTFRIEEPRAASTSPPMAQAVKKRSIFELRHQQKVNLPCGGRRCSNCGRCRDWKLVVGGNWKSYSDWERVLDPDATCHYSQIRHVLDFRSWNCRCH